jgi:site-specific DNA recombinase
MKLPPVIKDDAWPAIIEKQLFDEIQATLNSRAPKTTHPRVTSSSYLLSGLIKCHKCGAAYIGYGAKSGRFHYYVCGTTYSKGKDTCPSQHLPKEKIERYISEKVRGYILTDNHLMELIRLSNIEIDSTNKKFEGQLDVIDREIEEWEGQLDRLYEFIETRAVEPKRMARRLEEVQDKIDGLKKTRLSVEEDQWARQTDRIDPQKVLTYVHELRSFLDNESLFERKSFLRSFIQSIEADDDKMTINYTLPLPPDNSRKEVISVLDIVPPAPPSWIKGKTFEKIFPLVF